MPLVARCIEDSRSPVWEELTEAQIPASVREKIAKTPTRRPTAADVAKAAEDLRRLAKRKPKSGTRPASKPGSKRPSRENGVTVRTRPVPANPCAAAVAAREAADARLRRAGVDRAIIDAIPKPTAPSGNPARDRADEALRRRGVPESLISAIDAPTGGRR